MMAYTYRSFFWGVSLRVRLIAGLVLVSGLWSPGETERHRDPAATFCLRNLRTDEVRGPYALRGGSRLKLGGDWYRLDIKPDGNLFFREYRGEASFGPYEFVEGRIVTVGRMVLEFVETTAGLAFPTPVARPARIRGSERSVASLVETWEQHAPEPSVTAWMDVQRAVRLDWAFGGYVGSRENRLIRNEIGLAAEWMGVALSGALTFGVELEDAVTESSVSLPFNAAETGSGWKLGMGYRYRVLAQDDWRVLLHASLDWRHDELDLRYTALEPGTSSDGAKAVAYRLLEDDLVIEEVALMCGGSIGYDGDIWGTSASVSGILFSEMDVEGSLDILGSVYGLDADRSHPVFGTVGAWYRYREWQMFGEYSAGAETGLRFGLRRLF